MGTPPAPPYATLYYSIYEDSFLHEYKDSLLFYKRFIDDMIGIWLCDPDHKVNEICWCTFQDSMNAGRGLQWEFSEPSNHVDFMDMTVSIHGNWIQTTLFEKPLNLYLYIPPHSAHPSPPDSFQVLFMGPCLKSSPFAQMMMIKQFAPKSSSADCWLGATKQTTCDPFSTMPLNMLKPTLAPAVTPLTPQMATQ